MVGVIVNDSSLQSIADAIRAKTGGTETYKPAEMAAAIQAIQTGGCGTPAGFNDVNFRDYDGTIVASYSAADFANLSAMPDNPTHDGLTAQGWNWSLADAKAYVSEYRKLEIGQMYITDDGKTRVHIHLEKGRLSPMLGCCPNGTVVVDWGDGTGATTLTGTSTTTVVWTSNHNYAEPGDYVITLTVTGSMGFYGNSSSNQYSGILRYSSSADARNNCYRNAVTECLIGSGVTSIGGYAFRDCFTLARITIPSGVTSIGDNAFDGCCHLSNVTIPSSVSSIGSYAFSNCRSLSSVTISSGVTSIGSYAFQNCTSLSNVTISSGVTSIGSSAFYYCLSLSSITIPSSVTSIGDNAFSVCHTLSSITISSGVTSIGSSAFYYCLSLSSITIPSSVTSIGDNAFKSCCSLGEIHLKPTTPPTVSNSNAWTSIPTDCKIYVPAGSLSAYTSATNYPSSSTYTYIEE